MFKMLPRIFGLNPSGADGLNGSVRFSVNGAALSAEQQAQLNVRSKRSLGGAFVARDVFHANGSTLEVRPAPITSVSVIATVSPQREEPERASHCIQISLASAAP